MSGSLFVLFTDATLLLQTMKFCQVTDMTVRECSLHMTITLLTFMLAQNNKVNKKYSERVILCWAVL